MDQKPVPYRTPESERFWDGCMEGRLLYQHCRSCGKNQFYPRVHCTACGSRDLVWRDSDGRGVIYSYTVVHRAPGPAFQADVPYVLALVELKEGFRMMANIIGVQPDEVAIGDPVVVDFEERGEGVRIPQFRPLLSFDRLEVGKFYGEGRLECTEELIGKWNDIYPEFAGRGDPSIVPPGVSGAIVMTTYDAALKGRPKGNIHGKQVFEWHRPARVNETLITRLFVEDKYVRGDRKWVIIRTETRSSDGEPVLDGRMHILWAE